MDVKLKGHFSSKLFTTLIRVTLKKTLSQPQAKFIQITLTFPDLSEFFMLIDLGHRHYYRVYVTASF